MNDYDEKGYLDINSYNKVELDNFVREYLDVLPIEKRKSLKEELKYDPLLNEHFGKAYLSFNRFFDQVRTTYRKSEIETLKRDYLLPILESPYHHQVILELYEDIGSKNLKEMWYWGNSSQTPKEFVESIHELVDKSLTYNNLEKDLERKNSTVRKNKL